MNDFTTPPTTPDSDPAATPDPRPTAFPAAAQAPLAPQADAPAGWRGRPMRVRVGPPLNGVVVLSDDEIASVDPAEFVTRPVDEPTS